MVYTWQFAPGSELSVVWKNSIIDSQDEMAHGFNDNFRNTFDATKLNSLSVKVLYYIDYQKLKKRV